MRRDRLGYLRRITNLLQAHLVMTSDERIISFDTTEDSQLVFSKMESENIDYAPILKDGAFIGYVNKKDLVGIIGKTCGELAREITSKNMISPKLSLESVLSHLTNEPFLFVAENKLIKGIITRADVNKRVFRTFFYIVLSELESLLADLIRIRLPCEKHLHLLSEDRAKDVLYNYWQAKVGNVEISIEQYLSFSDIINIILKSKDTRVWLLLGYTSKKQAENLKPLIDLRNCVMHSTRSLLGTEDSMLRIIQQYAQIWELLENLVENKDLNEDDILSVSFDKKNQNFRFLLVSEAVIRTPLNDIKGKELGEIGIEKIHKFLNSKNRRKRIDNTTMRRLKGTMLFDELFK